MERYFEIEAANRSLQLVRPIVSDILRKMREAQQIRESVHKEREKAEIHESSLLGLLSRAEKLLNDVEYHMKELESIGVLLKDLERGTIDFPCLHDSRIVYLCWTLGEETIHFWHETDRGFADRKMVNESFYNASQQVA